MLKNIVKDVKKAVGRDVSNANGRHGMIGRVLRVGEVEVRVEASLGEGGFACIYTARDTNSRTTYALKHVRMSGDEELIEDVKTEVAHMHQLRGQPNVLALHAVSFEGPPVCGCVQESAYCAMQQYVQQYVHDSHQQGREEEAFLLLDLCRCNLVQYVTRRGRLPAAEVQSIMQHVCRGVAWMHCQPTPLAHR